MKHVKLDQHLVLDQVVVGDLIIKKVVTEYNLLDIFMESLHKPTFLKLIAILPISDIHGPETK